MKGFLGSGALEVAIEASFVYFLIAIFCSAANEWIATLLNARANTLRATVRELLNNQILPGGREFVELFCAHPLIASIMRDENRSVWLHARSFTAAVLDLATKGIEGSISFQALEQSLSALPPGDVRTSLLALIQNAAGDLNRAEDNIQAWFNEAMSRASVSYRRRIHAWTVTVSAILTIVANADTIALLRSQSGLVCGWTVASLHCGPLGWLSRLAGWSLTVTAASLGAPFWFDVFNKLSGVRKNEAIRKNEPI